MMQYAVKHTQREKGESILEVLLAIAIFAIVVPPILYTMGLLSGDQFKRNIYLDALVYTEDGKTIMHHLKSEDWDTVATNGTYTITSSGGIYALTPLSITPTPEPNGLIRTIDIEDVRRLEGKIVETGGVVDSATKKITIQVSWETNQEPILTQYYITRSDVFGSYAQSSLTDFAQEGALFSGTLITPTGTPGDGKITLGEGDPGSEVGLNSWWKMTGEYSDSDAEIDVAPSGTNNLRIYGDVAFDQGRFGKSALFDESSQYLAASSSASLEITGQLSIVSWIRAETISAESAIVFKKTGAGVGYSLGVDEQGHAHATVGNTSDTLSALNSTTPLIDGRWHQLASTYDGESLRVFVDGIEGEQVDSGVNVLGSSNSPIYIARDPTGGGSTFVGEIDDVQIYAVALSPEEIKALRYSTYTSPIKDFGSSVLLHSIKASAFQPSGTETAIQISLESAASGSCEGVDYRYIGPDGTEDTFFSSAGVDLVTIVDSVPGSQTDPIFANPGRCLRYRAHFASPFDVGSNNPSLDDIRFTYSQ